MNQHFYYVSMTTTTDNVKDLDLLAGDMWVWLHEAYWIPGAACSFAFHRSEHGGGKEKQ